MNKNQGAYRALFRRACSAAIIVCSVCGCSGLQTGGVAVADSTAPCIAESSIPVPIQKAQVVFLGELHGTNEGPAFVGSLACGLVGSGTKVIVALEMPVDEQNFLDGPQEAVIDIAKRSFWAGAKIEGKWMHDGRSSQAVFDLINRIKDMRAGGKSVQIAAIDVGTPRGDAQLTRNETMALNIKNTVLKHPDAKIIVFLGRMHARKASRQLEKSVASYLEPSIRISLTMAYENGSAWNCKSGSQGFSCDANSVSSVLPSTLPAKDQPFVIAPSIEFDGYFYVGPISASPPAVSTSRRETGQP